MSSDSERINRDEMMMQIARIVAQRGTCLRARVGCVIEKEGRILMTGYNGSLSGEPHCLDVGCLMEEGHCVRTVHAEANAVARAAKLGISIDGATLHVTGWAQGICRRCRMLVLSAGVTRIVTDQMK